jgi:DNA-directed RNA polymerase specialized sigma24 family protein
MDVPSERTEPDGPSGSVRRDSNPDGLHELYAVAVPEAAALAFLLTGDAAEAERIAESAFVRATGRFAHRLRQDRFAASLRRRVVALLLSRERRDVVSNGHLDGGTGYGMGDGIWGALMSLPARERVAVVLRYCWDLAEEDIAHALGCSLPAARAALSRGRELLGAAAPEGPEPTP